MTEQRTQLQRAQNICDSYTPTEPSDGCYVYLYLGKATQDSTPYSLIDGGYYAERINWHVDWNLDGDVCYCGRGENGRINVTRWHPVFPTSSEYRLKIAEDLSFDNSVELERLVIAELGHILDPELEPGCLTNTLRHHQGPRCCAYPEAECKRRQLNSSSLDVVALTAGKTVIARGSANELAKQTGVHSSNISACVAGKQNGAWSSTFNQPLYFCFANEVDDFIIAPMKMDNQTAKRAIIARNLGTGEIFIGTARELARHAGLTSPGNLHAVARGEYSQTSGFTVRYLEEVATELEAPPATCDFNLSAPN